MSEFKGETKFQVGDEVIGNELANYYMISKKGYRSVVLGYNYDGAKIKIKNMSSPTAYFFVYESYFDHAKVKATNISRAFYKNKIKEEKDGYLYLGSK